MIYRRWSLLTGPTSLIAGIIGTVVVANLLFVENGSLKGDQKKQQPSTSTK